MPFEIIQVVQELSSVGGVETVAYELARAFGRAGVSHKVLASAVGADPGLERSIELVAPWLARIRTRGRLRHIGRLIVVPLFTIAATLALRRHRHAVVLSHGDSLSGDILVVHAINAASLAEKRRQGNWTWMLNPMHVWVGVRDQWMIGRLRYRRFVAVSRRVSEELQRHYGVPESRISVIPNGIDLTRFRPDPASREAIRREFGVPQDAKLLLFAGHEFGRKGLAHAVGALAKLRSDTWLLVVGSDNPSPYRRLAGAAAGRLVFAGERKDMPAVYAAADAFVLPTSYETFSLVCMEAMASGVPVFATPVGGIEDYLQDGVNGYAIPPEPGGIAATIGPVLCDEALLRALGEGAQATARNFAWEEVADRYFGLLEAVWTEKYGAGHPNA